MPSVDNLAESKNVTRRKADADLASVRDNMWEMPSAEAKRMYENGMLWICMFGPSSCMFTSVSNDKGSILGGPYPLCCNHQGLCPF